MANLKRLHTWKKWAPDIGDNRELPEPVLYLELATGLTAAQMHQVREGLARMGEVKLLDDDSVPLDERLGAHKKALREVYVEALGDFVRVQGGPHTVDGMPLATLVDYVALVQTRADWGTAPLLELHQALHAFNSLSGPDELFSLRRSGGARTTRAQSVEPASEKTAAP